MSLSDQIDLDVICLGDFNARIGNLNNDFDDYIFDDSQLSHVRNTCDMMVKPRGMKLTEIMESMGFVVLNGRSRSDAQGCFTYMSERGNSLIDLAWVNCGCLQNIIDFSLTDLSVFSDHLLCSILINKKLPIKLNSNSNSNNQSYIKSLRWNQNKNFEYTQHLSNDFNIYFNSDDANALFENLTTTIKAAMKETNMYTTKHLGAKKTFKSPWYNRECANAKKAMKKSFAKLSDHNFDLNFLFEYNQAKKNYKYITDSTKKSYNDDIKVKLRETKNAKDFWLTIKKFRKKGPYHESDITLQTCVDYFRGLHKPSPRILILSNTNVHNVLDKSITLEEINFAVTRLKNGKAAGPDGIPNECFKNLPPNWTHYLQNMFNVFLSQETIPDDWCNSLIKLMYKKGNTNDPNNYRPIALENTCLKIFSFLLKNRLYNLVEKHNLLPEEQCGFREKRSCTDNIFIAKTVVDIQLYVNKKPLLAIVVDYKKAFDTVPHDKLFQKLNSLGINGKFIRTMAKMYDKANISLNLNNQISEKIAITKGVLQGDVLSPLLYALYTSDMPSSFRNKGHKGIKIDSETEILMITFADDTLIFANSTVDCQDKLNELDSYCEQNDLIVNASKTNIMHFFKGRPRKLRPMYYKGATLEYVKTTRYLGVNFSCSGKFLSHAKETVKKSHLAVSNVLSILYASKSDTWETKCVLFDSSAKSVLLYASEAWALPYTDLLETVQSKFFKRLLHLPFTTPNYLLRNEFDRLPIKYYVIKSMYDWWCKLLLMPCDRLPKRCYEALKAHIDSNLIPNNWTSQMKSLLYSCDELELWSSQNGQLACRERETFLAVTAAIFKSCDDDRIYRSSYSPIYKYIIDADSNVNYLNFISNINKIRIVAQLRLNSVITTKLYINAEKITLDKNLTCSFCNLNEPNDLNHVIYKCPTFSTPRFNYLSNLINENQSLTAMLSNISIQKLNCLYYFFIGYVNVKRLIED